LAVFPSHHLPGDLLRYPFRIHHCWRFQERALPLLYESPTEVGYLYPACARSPFNRLCFPQGNSKQAFKTVQGFQVPSLRAHLKPRTARTKEACANAPKLFPKEEPELLRDPGTENCANVQPGSHKTLGYLQWLKVSTRHFSLLP